MDSDSSLDENFQTKDEVAARVGRTQSRTESPQDRNSGSDSSFSLDDDDDDGELQPEPPGETPKSPVGGSNSVVSQEDEARSQSSFTSSSSANVSAYRSREAAQEANPEEEQDEEFDGNGSAENVKYESKEEEDGECEGSQDESNKHYPPADDAGDLSDVSDMDSRDSLEAVFAEDCKVKETVKDPSPSPDDAPSEHEKEEVEDGENSLGPKPPSPQPLPPPPPPPPVQHIETEQLDFEAEEQVKEVSAVNEDKEEGECEERLPQSGSGGDGDGKDDKSDGELKEGEDLEEGELTDEDEARPGEMEPRPVCRFYNRGQCTWGSSCRFVHPGVTDKGNYTMFELPRALLPVNGPPVYSPDYRPPAYEKTFQPVAVPFQAPRKEEVAPVFESAWERGLRHAKEMMRKATKRKEMDIDFEEKKMNLSLGQEELDKENDYYTRPASPIVQVKDDPDHWSYEDGADLYHPVGGASSVPPIDGRQHHHHHVHHGTTHQTSSAVPSGGDFWRRVHYEGVDARGLRVETEYIGRGNSGASERKERSRDSREVHRHHHHHPPEVQAHQSSGRGEHHHRHIVSQSRSESRAEHHAVPERRKKAALPPVSRSSANSVPLPSAALPPEKVPGAWRDEKYPDVPPSAPHSHKARGDEWADPWMRSKSPTRRSATAAAPSGTPAAAVRTSRRQHSFSSGSSYSSSSSSSRSTSRSSYSSFSSRSRSHSPRPSGVPPSTGPASSRPRHPSHRHAVPASPPATNHHQQPPPPPPPRAHHRSSSGAVPSSSRSSPRPLAPSAPRTPPLPPLPPPRTSSKSRSRSPLSRAHRRRVNANSGMNAAGGAVVSRQPSVHIQLSPRHAASIATVPPPRKAVRTSALSPTHGERKGGVLGTASYSVPPGMLSGIRGTGSAMVREPSPQLVRKALHATSIPLPLPTPRIIGTTTRAPQAAVAVAAAAAKSATETARRHRRRHAQHGKSGHGHRRSSLSHRSQSSSHSSRSDDDDDDNSGSGSTSDSSDSSVSSSSSTSSSSSSSSEASGGQRKKPSPQVRPKRFLIDDRAALANSMKVKAMDALKLSGQKQQIKLTLKAPGSSLVSGKRPLLDMPEALNMRNRDRPLNLPLMAGKKRPAPDSPPSPVESAQSAPKLVIGNMPKPTAKKAPSRREELLKQLKAVEDAIARKRSKITFPGTS